MGLLAYMRRWVSDPALLHKPNLANFQQAGLSNGCAPWPFSYDAAVRQCKGWVYRCAYGNAEAAAAVPLRLYVRQRAGRKMIWDHRKVKSSRRAYLAGDRERRPSESVARKLATFGDDFVEVPIHPVLDMLRTVGNDWNGYDFALFRFLSLELTGNAYVAPVVARDGTPQQLFPLLPHWVWIKRAQAGSDAAVGGYQYGPVGGQLIELEAEDVLHQKVASPRDLYYGLGKVEASWDALGLFASQRVLQKSIFDNNARPDAILNVEGLNSSDEAERLESRIADKLRGVRNAGKFLVSSAKVSYTPLNWSPSELGTDQRVLEEVAGVFGYPITKLLANDPNRSNAETGNAGWLSDTILPMLRRDEEWLNQSLLRLWGEEMVDNAVLAYDDPVPGNQDREITKNTAYVAGGIITPNEAREDLGLAPIDGGDKLRVGGTSLEEIDQPDAPMGGLFALQQQVSEIKGMFAAKAVERAEKPAHEPARREVPEDVRKAVAAALEPKQASVHYHGAPVTVHLPESKHTINLPEQPAPVVKVETPAPVVNVTPEVKAPDVVVNVEAKLPERKVTFARDERGNLTSANVEDA